MGGEIKAAAGSPVVDHSLALMPQISTARVGRRSGGCEANPLRRSKAGASLVGAVVLYEYTCPVCGVFEIARPMATAAPAETCPSCGERSSRRFSTPALTAPGSPLRRVK
jgi:putative FmdB family regulatory protein